MFGRFIQLFLLASMVLLLPTLFYLSRQHQEYSLAKDYSFMQTHSFQEHKELGDLLKQHQQLQESTQGSGAPPALDPEVAQKWRFADIWRDFGSSKKAQAGQAAQAEKAPPSNGIAGGASAPVAAIPSGAIMSKMGNETAKAELGRATWRFLHTMTLRFPEHPTQDDRDTLMRFIHDFSRLYPCGECAAHFQQLLKELPPQTSTRMTAALWLCTAHNRVNERLGKPQFPCDKLDETYDCGCGDDKKVQRRALL